MRPRWVQAAAEAAQSAERKEMVESKQRVLAVVSENWRMLGGVPAPFRADKDVVLAAVQSNGLALELAAPLRRADRAAVAEAVARDGAALAFASADLRADPDVVLRAVRNDGKALRFASKEVRADATVALAAVRQDPAALAFAIEPSWDVQLAAERSAFDPVPRVQAEAAEANAAQAEALLRAAADAAAADGGFRDRSSCGDETDVTGRGTGKARSRWQGSFRGSDRAHCADRGRWRDVAGAHDFEPIRIPVYKRV